MSRLEGGDALKAALLALPAAVEAKVLRKSAIAGAKVVRDAVKANAPVGNGPRKRGSGLTTPPGTIKRAVILKFAKELSDKDSATYVVTVRKGKGAQKTNRDAFYWIWVEKGHRIVRKRGGPTVGQVSAHPFFVPAYRATAATAQQKMKSVMETQLTALINGAGSGAP